MYIVFKRSPNIYCLIQGSCFICTKWKVYLNIRITTYHGYVPYVPFSLW